MSEVQREVARAEGAAGRPVKRALRPLAVSIGLAVALVLVLPDARPGPTGRWLKAAGLEPRFETVGGHRLRYVRAGEGPAVVLLHGFASSVYTWKDVLPVLARDYDVVALDLPGFGESDQPSDLDGATFPSLVVELMDRLGVARAAVVGNSLGGATAVGVAAGWPERVTALVLLDSAGFNFSEKDRPWMLRVLGGPAGKVLERLPIRGLLVRIGLRQVFHDPARITRERFNEYLAPVVRPGAIASMRSILLARARDASWFPELVRRVRAPTLVIWGREDRWVPAAQADLFVAAIPGARKVVLEACGHVPQEERPQDVLRLLAEFLPSS
jgi:pimeloyl-ACP methyl ester carboxylesterase